MKTKVHFFFLTTFAFTAALVLFDFAFAARGQESTIFTYQGKLNSSGSPASGVYDLKFSIYDSTNQPGVLIAGPLTNFTVVVTNGLFTTPLDFGVTPFDGSDRWLEIAVRTNGGGAFSTLAARQQITLTPYAIMARAALFAVSNFTVGATLVLPPTNAVIYSGNQSLFSSDSYEENVFVGPGAGAGGQANTAVGKSALGLGSGGGGNSAFGDGALSGLLGGYNNTAIGSSAMASYTNGSYNTALGAFTLGSLTGGSSNEFNTAEGWGALAGLTSGNQNTANGWDSLIADTGGTANTASGALSLYGNTLGGYNVAMGYQTLYSNTVGSHNTAVGDNALYSYNGVGYNIAVGDGALQLLTTGNDNIGIGDFGGHDITSGSWNIHIGSPGSASDDHTIKIGQQGTQNKTFIAGISGTSISGGAPVYVNSSGQLGSVSPVFIHTANAGNIASISNEGQGTKINNSLCNGKSGAILIVSPSDTGAGITPDSHPFFVQYRYDGSTGYYWYIVSSGGSIPVGQQFNVFVANP